MIRVTFVFSLACATVVHANDAALFKAVCDAYKIERKKPGPDPAVRALLAVHEKNPSVVWLEGAVNSNPADALKNVRAEAKTQGVKFSCAEWEKDVANPPPLVLGPGLKEGLPQWCERLTDAVAGENPCEKVERAVFLVSKTAKTDAAKEAWAQLNDAMTADPKVRPMDAAKKIAKANGVSLDCGKVKVPACP